jgi:hypothetical protein
MSFNAIVCIGSPALLSFLSGAARFFASSRNACAAPAQVLKKLDGASLHE